MIVDPVSNTDPAAIPSSQPTDDEQIVLQPPTPTPVAKVAGAPHVGRGPDSFRRSLGGQVAHVDDSPAWASPHLIAPIIAEMEKWSNMDAESFSCLSSFDLTNISDMGRMCAYQLGLDVDLLLRTSLNV